MRAEIQSMPPPFLQLVAHKQRWKLLEALAHSDRRVHELVDRVGEPANLVSYHLRRLREHFLVRERRSAADRRDVYYSLDLERLHGLFLSAGESLHPGLGAAESQPETRGGPGREALGQGRRVLFLCTHNSARSQMAEGILRHLAPAVEVASAGTEVTRVHPLALQAMAKLGIDISQHRSKPLSEFLGRRFDYVITVCDHASESCPVFPGEPERIHWSLPDPSSVEPEAQEEAFHATAQNLLTRIRYLVSILGRPDA